VLVCGYLSGAKCIQFAYGPADATATRRPMPASPGSPGKRPFKWLFFLSVHWMLRFFHALMLFRWQKGIWPVEKPATLFSCRVSFKGPSKTCCNSSKADQCTFYALTLDDNFTRLCHAYAWWLIRRQGIIILFCIVCGSCAQLCVQHEQFLQVTDWFSCSFGFSFSVCAFFNLIYFVCIGLVFLYDPFFTFVLVLNLVISTSVVECPSKDSYLR